MALTLEELDRRVSALEAAQKDTTETPRWVVAKLGRMSAVQDEHTLRLERIETRCDRIETKIDNFVRDLPGIVGDAVRGTRT